MGESDFEITAETCEQIQNYLKVALEICGDHLVSTTLLDDHTCEEYFENIGELRKRRYDEDLSNAEDELKNVLFLKDGAINMIDMSQTYVLEDNALLKYNIALAQLYNYLLQPFLDMRELAFSNLQVARTGMSNPNLGERPKKEFKAMFNEWQSSYVSSLESIQRLYKEYYDKTDNLQQSKLWAGPDLLEGEVKQPP